MKKVRKLFTFALLTFFISSISAYAREMNINELGDEAGKLKPNSSYVYVIGEYAFTSEHTLTTQDLMLAAKSIETTSEDGEIDSKPIYNKMSIKKIKRTYDKSFKPIGWEKDKNVLGTDSLGENLNIRYIDYQFYPEKSKADISVNVDEKEEYKDVLKNALNFDTNDYYGKNDEGKHALTYVDGKVSGLLLKKNEIYLSDEDKKKYEGSDYFFAYILEVPQANDQTKITLKGISGEDKDISYKDFDIKAGEDGTPGIVILVPINHTKFQSNKKITITVDVDGNSGKEYEATSYELDLSGLTFQQDSPATLKLDGADDTDKSTMEKWGYGSSKNLNMKLEDSNLSGMLIPQTLGAEAFGADKTFGYYFDFTFELPKGTDTSKVKISYLSSNDINSVTKTFDSKEYDSNNNLTILHRFEPSENNCGENCKLYFSVDLDGDGENYLPTIYTIDYSKLEFAQKRDINYKYKDKDGVDKTETLKDYEDTELSKDMTIENTDYRTFDGWYDTNGEKLEKVPLIGENTENTSVDVTAHWTLNVDKFINDVITDLNSETTTNSDNFKGQFNLTQEGNTITINLDSPKVPLTKLADTSIPGAIAYLLEKGEIEEITLKVGDQSVTYNSSYTIENGKEYSDESDRTLLDEEGQALKEEIVKGAKGAFDEELSKKEDSATLDQIEYDEKTFTLTIGATDETVTLVDSEGNEITDEAKKTYTFNFDSDFVVVDAEGTLGAKDISEALKKDYTKVYLDSDVTVAGPIDIEKQETELLIEPLNEEESSVVAAANILLEKEGSGAEESKKISVTTGDYVIDVKSGNVTLKNINLAGGTTTGLKVEDGANVTVENMDVSVIKENPEAKDEEIRAAIIVNGKLTANNVKNENESYALPTIAAVASDSSTTTPESKVTVSDMTKNNKYNLVDRTTNTKFHSVKSYNGEFYYNDVNNSKIYFASVMDTVQGVRPSPYQAFQIYFYNEEIDFSKFGYVSDSTPEKDGKKFKEFKLGSSEGSKIEDKQLAQNVFGANSEILLYAVYDTKESE